MVADNFKSADIMRHTKQVKGKSVIVPSLQDVADLVKNHVGKVLDTTPTRHQLAALHGTQMACSVTVRRHLKALGKL